MTKLSLLSKVAQIVDSGDINPNYNIDYGGEHDDSLLTVAISNPRSVSFFVNAGLPNETVSVLPANEVWVLVKQLLGWLSQNESPGERQ